MIVDSFSNAWIYTFRFLRVFVFLHAVSSEEMPNSDLVFCIV